MTKIAGVAGEILEDQVTVYKGEEEYTGRAVNVDYNLDEFTLETRDGYEWITGPDAIDHLESVMYFEKTSLSKITPNRFKTREYDADYVEPAVKEIRGSDGQEFIPLTQKMPEGHYEVVDGHKTLYAFMELGYNDVWTRILNPEREDSWLEIFAEDHFPSQRGLEERSTGTYTDEEVEESIDRMLETFPKRHLEEIPVIQRNIGKNVQRIT